jgi:hypothetical protein
MIYKQKNLGIDWFIHISPTRKREYHWNFVWDIRPTWYYHESCIDLLKLV